MSEDIIYILARYVTSLKYDDLPLSAVEATKRDIFDSLATGIVGSSALGIKELIELADEWDSGSQATVFVFGKKYPAHVAAQINTVMIHGFDYDDTHDLAMMHCGAIVVSSALAAAELCGGVSGKEFITAVTAGLDIHCRFGLATTIGIVESGWVYTPLFGIFGAVAAAGHILGLTEKQMVNAFGIAYAQASGNYQAITDSAWTKRFQPGFASSAALISCQLAKKGVSGANNIIQGKYNIFHVYLHDRCNLEELTKDLGTYFTHEDLAFKPWPCCRPNQPPINACLEAKEKFNMEPSDIKHVEILLNEHLYICSCTPEEVRKHPKTIVDCQFSIPYCCACALINGKVGLSDFTEEMIKRPDVLALAAKIDGVIDADIEREYRARVCPVIVKIEMNNGQILEHRLDVTLGCKDKPMSDDDFTEKMKDCIRFSAEQMPENTAETIKDIINQLEFIGDSNIIVNAMKAISIN